MLAYDATCPHCGHRNIDMYLEETDGWMECDKCGTLHQFEKFRRGKRIPVFQMNNIPKELFVASAPVLGAAASQ